MLPLFVGSAFFYDISSKIRLDLRRYRWHFRTLHAGGFLWGLLPPRDPDHYTHFKIEEISPYLHILSHDVGKFIGG